MDAESTGPTPVIPCLLSTEAVGKLRRYIFNGTEAFANRAMDHAWLNDTFGPTFHDIEIGISTEGYTCEKAPMLRPHEYATFIRITEKFAARPTCMEPSIEIPRVLTLGLVLSLTGHPSYPAQCRLWESCATKWVGGNGEKPLAILNDEMEMGKILNELMTGFGLACSKPLDEAQSANATSGAEPMETLAPSMSTPLARGREMSNE